MAFEQSFIRQRRRGCRAFTALTIRFLLGEEPTEVFAHFSASRRSALRGSRCHRYLANAFSQWSAGKFYVQFRRPRHQVLPRGGGARQIWDGLILSVSRLEKCSLSLINQFVANRAE